MVEREIKGTLCSLMQGFPVVTITGPRQSGKSTLAKAVFPSLVYGGSDSHVQNGVRVFGWDAVAEVFEF